MQKNIRRNGNANAVKVPAYPLTGPELFNRLRGKLTEAFRKEQTFRHLANVTGQPQSNVQHWFQAYEHPQVIFFLCLLEQLPENKRAELLREFCRELPLLTHFRLAHDPLALTGLENILRETAGLTVIRGGSEFQRTFVATALCHSAARLFGQSLPVAGLDVHEPRRFVPVPGVMYFREPQSSSRLERLIEEAWQGVASSSAPLILLNGVWSIAPGLKGSVVQLAHKRHVLVADPTPPDLAETERNLKVRVVNLSQHKENQAWIRVTISVR